MSPALSPTDPARLVTHWHTRPTGRAASTERAEPTLPSAAPSDTTGDAGAPVTGQDDQGVEHATVVPWLAGAGLLAGGALLALIRHRRRQFRYRSPGRSITQTPAELQDAERALLTAGASRDG